MASTNSREVLEGVQQQGEDESIAYTLNVSAIGSDPGAVVVVVKDVAAAALVTATVMPINAPSVADGVISLSPLRSLTAGVLYRVEVKYTVAGNILESYFYVQAQE